MMMQDKFDVSKAEFVDEPPPGPQMRDSKYSPLYEMFEDLWDQSKFDKWVRLEVEDKKQALNLRNRLMDYATKVRKPVETAIREEEGQTNFYFRPRRK